MVEQYGPICDLEREFWQLPFMHKNDEADNLASFLIIKQQKSKDLATIEPLSIAQLCFTYAKIVIIWQLCSTHCARHGRQKKKKRESRLPSKELPLRDESR